MQSWFERGVIDRGPLPVFLALLLRLDDVDWSEENRVAKRFDSEDQYERARVAESTEPV